MTSSDKKNTEAERNYRTLKYAFESTKKGESHRKSSDAEKELAILLNRLGPPDTSPGADKERLLPFVKEHNQNILWYENRLQRERKIRVWFLIGTLLLLLLIPGFVLLITWVGSATNDTGSMIAALTAVLTSVIAIHKVLASWLDKRQLIAHFAKASADLKSSLFDFEDNWKGNILAADNGALSREFIKAAVIATKNARAIARKEEEDFNKIMLYPVNIDLAATLQQATAAAKSLVTSHTSPLVSKAEAERQEAEEKARNIVEAAGRVKSLSEKLGSTKNRVLEEQKKLKSSPSAEEKEIIEARLSHLNSRAYTLEDELDEARAELGGTQR